MKWPVAFGLFSILFALPATAQEFRALELYKACNGQLYSGSDEVACLAYIRGFTAGIYLGLYQGQLIGHGRKSCLPTPETGNSIDVTQAELIAKKFFAEHPERLTEPAPTLLLDALSTAFHCHTAPAQ